MKTQSWMLVGVSLLLTVSSCAAVTDDDDLSEGESEPASTAEEGLTSAERNSFVSADVSASEKSRILAQYRNIDPNGKVPRKLRDAALVFFDLNKAKISNENYVTVVDFSKHSSKQRLFIMNMRSGDVTARVVAHGKGSDAQNDGYAEHFSNVAGSEASSLGYYLTGSTYTGKHGRSLKLDGLSSTNSNARSRAVVIHGASYVSEGRSKQGRSWGCLALDEDDKNKVIDQLRNGSVIYAGLSN